MAGNATAEMIKLNSQNGMDIPSSQTAALQSLTICNVLEHSDSDEAILVPNVSADIPGKVSEYCKKHAEAEEASKTETTEEDNTTKMIKLRSQDGEEILLSEKVAMQSITICHALEHHDQAAIDAGMAIPVPNVKADILKMVFDYCEKHVEAEDASKTETTEEGSSSPQLNFSKMFDKAADASKTETTVEGSSTQLGSLEMPDKTAEALKTETTKEGSSSQLGSSKISDQALKEWDEKFLAVDVDTLYYLLLAANYLNISKLLNALCRKVAGMTKGKSVEEIRKNFGIVNDFTEEEEEHIRNEAPWAFY